MKSRHISCAVLFIAIVPFSVQGFAQQGDVVRDSTPDATHATGDYTEENDSSLRTKAVDEANSRAEKEAERLVSMPPEKIVLMLQQEPGLFLEVKKLLVRRAYSQGRVLDPKDLSDDAVFRLVRDDEEVRALVTQQILDRGYIRAKPTREELVKEAEEQQRIQEKAAAQNYSYASSQNGGGTWGSGGFGSTQRNGPQNGAPYSPNGTQQQGPSFSQPQNQMNSDQRRTLLQASTDTGQDTTGLPFEAVAGGSTTPQLSSDQMQQLLSAYRGGQLPSGLAGQVDVGKLTSTLGGNAGQAPTVPQSQEQAYMQQNERMQFNSRAARQSGSGAADRSQRNPSALEKQLAHCDLDRRNHEVGFGRN